MIFDLRLDQNRAGEYGPGNLDELVAKRVALARSFVPHRFERTRPNGTVLEIHGNSMPGGSFVTIYKDITERQKTENALKESHERLEIRVEQRTAELRALNERLLHESAERKRALEALRESEEWIRLIADKVPALIGYVDSSERYRFANKQYEKWFGLPSDWIVSSVGRNGGASPTRRGRAGIPRSRVFRWRLTGQ